MVLQARHGQKRSELLARQLEDRTSAIRAAMSDVIDAKRTAARAKKALEERSEANQSKIQLCLQGRQLGDSVQILNQVTPTEVCSYPCSAACPCPMPCLALCPCVAFFAIICCCRVCCCPSLLLLRVPLPPSPYAPLLTPLLLCDAASRPRQAEKSTLEAEMKAKTVAEMWQLEEEYQRMITHEESRAEAHGQRGSSVTPQLVKESTSKGSSKGSSMCLSSQQRSKYSFHSGASK